MDSQVEVRTALKRFTSNIPPFPKTAKRVMDLLRDPGIQLTKIGNVVALDQGLASRVLRLANSAYFGLPQQVNSVRDAIVLLGLANVRNVVISASVGHIFLRGLDAYRMEEGTLWEHSVGTAYAAQILSRGVNMKTYSVAFSAGLLHDVGKVAIDMALKPVDKRELASLIRTRGEHEAEREIAGLGHGDVGGAICERWNLPPEIIAAVKYHHAPAEAPEGSALPALIATSNLCARLVLREGTDLMGRDFATAAPGCYLPDQATLERIEQDLPTIVSASRELLTGVSEVLGEPAAPGKK